jgi:hypothetical protein
MFTGGKFVLAADGNLGLFDHVGKPIWGSLTTNRGIPPYSAILQNDGNFVLKDSLNNKIWASNTAQTDVSTATIQNPMFGVAKVPEWNRSNPPTLLFSENNQSTNTLDNIFTFQDISTTTYSNKCNVQVLQDECNVDPACTGFIHSDVENTWQKILYDSQMDMFKITNKLLNLHVKETKIDMKDASCMKGTPIFVESSMYNNYPKDDDFIMNGNQCNTVDKSMLIKKRQEYDTDNSQFVTSVTNLFNIYPSLPTFTNQNNNLNKQITNKSKEYTKVQKDIEKKKSTFSSTFQQQQEDLMLLENVNKSYSILWGISALVIIGIVVSMRNRS